MATLGPAHLREGVEAAISAVGGQSELARRLGLVPGAVHNWLHGRGIPASRVPKVAQVTGVPMHILRPDLFRKSAVGVAEAQAPFAPWDSVFTEARALGLDPDAIAIGAIRKAVAEEKARVWQEENREAIESWNEWTDRNELPLAKHRMF